MTDDRFGFELPLLLAGAFRALVDDLHDRLAERGHPAARPIHGFALQALGSGGTTITDLGRRLGVSKQAAAKTVIGLEHLEYVERRRNPHDRRAALIRRTSRGDELLALSAEVFEGLRERWICELGVDRVRGLESDLERISANVKGSKLGDLSGWLR